MKDILQKFSMRSLLILIDLILYATAFVLLHVGGITYKISIFWFIVMVLVAKDFFVYFVGKSHTEERIIDFFITSLKESAKGENK